jgi:hypothetical protein
MGMKTRMRLRPPIGGGVCRAEHNGKKYQKLWKGEVLPLDGSLLMGDSFLYMDNASMQLHGAGG